MFMLLEYENIFGGKVHHMVEMSSIKVPLTIVRMGYLRLGVGILANLLGIGANLANILQFGQFAKTFAKTSSPQDQNPTHLQHHPHNHPIDLFRTSLSSLGWPPMLAKSLEIKTSKRPSIWLSILGSGDPARHANIVRKRWMQISHTYRNI